MQLCEGLIPTKDHPTKNAQHSQNVVTYLAIQQKERHQIEILGFQFSSNIPSSDPAFSSKNILLKCRSLI